MNTQIVVAEKFFGVLIRLFLGALLSLTCALQVHAGALAIGQLAPLMTAITLDGNAFNLETDGKGKVVIVNFWASWCSPCRKEMPALESYYTQHKSEGLIVLAINMDDPKNTQVVRDIMRVFSFPAAFARDAHFDGYARIWRMPMTFIIDRNGILRKDGSVGDPKIDLPLLENLVTPLLAQSLSAP